MRLALFHQQQDLDITCIALDDHADRVWDVSKARTLKLALLKIPHDVQGNQRFA